MIDNIPAIIAAAKVEGNSLLETLDIVRDAIADQFNDVWDATGPLAANILNEGQAIVNDIYDSMNVLCESNASPVSDIITAGETLFQAAWNAAVGRGSGDPIILDLDGNGVELTSRADSNVYFNIAGTDYQNMTAWAGGNDGMLVDDKDGSGAIDSVNELIGGTTPAGGFADLAANYDTNHDGVIDASDAGYGSLRVWTDANGNSRTDTGELSTLSALGITQIALNATNTNYQISGNNITQESTFVMNGVAHQMVDAWFAFDTVNTTYTGSYTLDPRVLFLPEQRGYGNIPNLSIAMSLDPTLLDMVTSLAEKDAQGLFAASSDVREQMKAILYRWAGVDTVPLSALNGFGGVPSGLDTQQLAFIEKVMGRSFNGNIVGYPILVPMYDLLAGSFSAHILAQAGLGGAMGNPVYDPVHDVLSGGADSGNGTVLRFGEGGAVQAIRSGYDDFYIFQPGDAGGAYPAGINEEAGGGVDTIFLPNSSPGDVKLWTGQVGGGSAIHIQYTATDAVEIYGDYDYNNGGGVLSDRVERVVFGDGTVWDLTQGLHILNDDTSRNMSGTRFDDVIEDGSADGYLSGYGGNDTLVGHGGVDDLFGGAGDDTYVFSPGDSPITVSGGYVYGDNVYEYADQGADKVVLHGVLPADVKLWGEVTGGGSVIHVRYTAADQIDIAADYDYSNGGGILSDRVEQIVFDNGTVWDLTQGLHIVNDDTWRLLYATSYADVVEDGNANGYINALAGNDTLIGHGGVDDLFGGTGDDTYVFSPGDSPITVSGSLTYGDHVIEYADEGVDKIVLHGVLPEDVKLWTDNAAYNERIRIQYTSNDEIDITADHDYVNGGFLSNRVEQIVFDNGTVWDLTQGLHITAPDDTAISLTGTAYGDIIEGGGGDDYLSGYGGSDTLIGHGGADYLAGGAGNDTYAFSVGDGQDFISESDGIDKVVFDSTVSVDSVTYSRANSYDLAIAYGTGADKVIVSNFFYPGYTTYQIESVQFSDGTVQDVNCINTLLHTLRGTSGSDSLSSFDTIDTTFIGGEGDDYLTDGYAGNSTYNFSLGDGQDTITDYGGTDKIVFDASVSSSSVTYSHTGSYDLAISYGTGDDKIVVSYFFYPGYATYQTESVQFSNGTMHDVSYINAQAHIIRGTSGNDYLQYFDDGDSTFIGGTGNDNIYGNTGNDTYQFSLGDGQDTVTDFGGADKIVFDATVTPSAVAYQQSGNDLIISYGSGGDKITVSSFFYSGATTNQIESVQFSNGTVHDVSYITAQASALYGTSGNDTLDNGTGAGTMYGGLGNDTYVVNNAGDVVVENTGEGTDLVRSSITYTLPANVENLTLTGASAINGTGNALNNVITGNSAANTLDGGAGVDTLIGGAGNDVYIVDNTGDVVTENASEGTDTVNSGVTYTLAANVENLTLTGTTAINGTGNTLVNVITGNSANNTLDGGTGADTLIGGAGNDTYIVDNVGDVITENANGGTDAVNSSVTYTLSANVENLTLTGTTAINGTGNTLDNVLTGNSAVNILTGGAGNDTLNGGTGADTMIGGTGNDTYIVDNTADVVTENASEGTDLVQSSVTYTLSANVENLTLTGTTAINGTGNTLDNVLDGSQNTAINTLAGGAGNDTYIVGTGDVVVEAASAGTDTVQAGITYTLGTNLENLVLTGTSAINGTGNTVANIITGNSANNTLDGGTGADTLIGGAGNDTYIVDNTGDVVTENANEGADAVNSSVTYTLSANVENLTLTGTTAINGTGNTLDNVLTGNSAVNILTGGAGNDTLNGGTGADTMIGGTGNDTYVVDNTGDVITENANEGTDSVSSSVTYTLAANVENLTLTGTTAINGTGNALDNILDGSQNTAVNTLTGGTGNDTYIVGTGDVVVETASAGTDTVQAGITYTLVSNVENLTLIGTSAINGTGNTLDNVIFGNSGANTLNGSSGNDMLHGGDGLDTLTGGTGADSFVFEAATAYNNIDVITDFATSQADKIDVKNLLTAYNPATDTLSNFVKFMNDGAGNDLLQVDRDGTGTGFGFQAVTKLTGVTNLDAATLVSSGNLIVH